MQRAGTNCIKNAYQPSTEKRATAIHNKMNKSHPRKVNNRHPKKNLQQASTEKWTTAIHRKIYHR
jgi:hypothetical protein